jgi:hypothetical protein
VRPGKNEAVQFSLGLALPEHDLGAGKCTRHRLLATWIFIRQPTNGSQQKSDSGESLRKSKTAPVPKVKPRQSFGVECITMAMRGDKTNRRTELQNQGRSNKRDCRSRNQSE